VAGTSTGAIKYVVTLSAERREQLEVVINSGKRPAQLITKARILLKADVSEAGKVWTDRMIAAALDISVNTVAGARRQLVEEGFEATAAQIQPELRASAHFRRRGRSQVDRAGLLPGSQGLPASEPEVARSEYPRTERRRDTERQYDRTDS
jgi:hypothetical protein